MPGFIKKTTQLFVLDSGDVSVAQEPRADGETTYSTSDDSRASKLAEDAHLAGGIGPFSAAASMKVSKDSSSEIKTARLDVTRNFNKERSTARGAFLAQPQTKLDPAYVAYIHDTDVVDVEQISSTLGIFYARASNEGGLIRKSYTMQATREDTQSSLEAELTAQYGGLIYSASGGASFGETHTSRSNGAAMSMSFHAEGGDTSVWLEPGGDLDAIQSEWAHSFDDGYPTYPWGVELRPIWELVQKVDQAKGDALQELLTQRWAQESGAFSPTHFFEPLPDGFAESYTVRGCSNPAHCGVFRRVDAHCTDTTSDWCPGGQWANGNSDETKCDRAPVYQRVGEGGGVDGGGPVLYRGYYSADYTFWKVGPSYHLADCADYDGYLLSGLNQGPTGGAPTDPGYSAGGGWTDIDANPYGDVTGTISVIAGGGGDAGGGGH
eukprot:COSAG06_NODE_700_length_12958_cov_24.639941_3_plen_437_part_00